MVDEPSTCRVIQRGHRNAQIHPVRLPHARKQARGTAPLRHDHLSRCRSAAAHPTLRSPGTLIAVLCWLGAFHCRSAEAIGTCPAYHVVKDGSGDCHCWPANVTTCCTESALQGVQACMEYEQLGFSARSCISWGRATSDACNQYCGDPIAISNAVYDICKFGLQVLNDGPLTLKYCEETRVSFLNQRYAIGCLFNETNCTGDQGNPEGDACMAECGNFAGCNCREQKGSPRPDKCDGETVLKGPMPGFDGTMASSRQNYSCFAENVPLKCRSNLEESTRCARFRLCPADMCIIKNVKCPPLDQCTLPGFCEKTEGLCYYKNKQDGTPCDDGKQFTVDDTCQNGVCKGETDYCLRYNVTCPVYSDCVISGICQRATGLCSFSKKPDDYPCDDWREYTVEDRCQNGFCSGRSVDLCVEQAINCEQKVPNDCNNPGTCDPQTGLCSLPIPVSNRTCDDMDATSVNDTCIDGLCIGYATANWADQKFLTLGEGSCADRKGRQMPSYSCDTQDEKGCLDICKEDRQCFGFSYSAPVCTIYGTIRTRPPSEDGRSYSFQGGSIPMAVIIEEAVSVKGQRMSVCRKKDEYGDTVLDTSANKMEVTTLFGPLLLLGFFFILLVIFCVGPIFRCFRTCCCGVRRPKVLSESTIIVSGAPPCDDDSGDDQDLRKVGQQPMLEPPPLAQLEPLPDAPDSPPHQLMPPDSPGSIEDVTQLTPSQALQPLVLSPSPGMQPSNQGDTESQGSKKKWKRQVGKKKQAWRDTPEAEKPPPPSQSNLSEDRRVQRGPNIAPASVANTGMVGFGLL